jgi:hypothetical protein
MSSTQGNNLFIGQFKHSIEGMKRQIASSYELLQHENLICSHGHRNLEHDTSTLVIRSMKELFEVSKYHKSIHNTKI